MRPVSSSAPPRHPFVRPLPLGVLLALVGIMAVAAVLRFARPGADVPHDAEGTFAPLLDAFWYMEAGAGPAEGSQPESIPNYDPPVWTSLARVWFSLAGASLGTAQALGALVSLLSLLLTWRVVRAGCGERAGLAAAATLAVLYPFVALSRTTLIYGPVTLALLIAAAVWLRARCLPFWPRVAHEAAAWILVLATGLAVRPPAWALLGGLALASLARWPRLRWAALGSGLLGAGLLAAFLADPGRLGILHRMDRMGGIWAETALRLSRKLDPNLGLGEVLSGWVSWGAIPTSGGSPGFVSLAPWATLVATLGVVLAVTRRGSLTTAQRETLLVFVGWWGAFIAFLPFFHPTQRPLRYFMIIAPPVAALAGFALGHWLPRRSAGPLHGPGEAGGFASSSYPVRRPMDRLREADRWVALIAAATGACVWSHLSLLLFRGQADRVPTLAWEGASLGLIAWALVVVVQPRRRGVLVALMALLVVGSGLVRSSSLLRAPTYALDAQREAQEALRREGRVFLGGPYSSFIALGSGLPRRRTPWLVTWPHAIKGTIERLQAEGITHVALDTQQEASSRLTERFAEQGYPLTLVSKLRPRPGNFGPAQHQVLIYRFPWAASPARTEREREH